MSEICIIPGTHHEIIRMTPVVRACKRQECSDWFVLHAGQHYSHHMDRVFFEEMELHEAGYNPDAEENDEGVSECIQYGGFMNVV